MSRKLAVFSALAATALALAGAGPAHAKELSFPAVRILATVAPDGSMQVVEERTFGFEGEFSRARQTFPLSADWEYRDFTVSEGGRRFSAAGPADRDPVRTRETFHLDVEGADLVLTWYYRAADELRTFRIEYTVAGAVTAFRDAAELYWKFIGDQTEVPARNVDITVRLPQPGATHPHLRIFQHGPASGRIRAADATTIVATTPRVPARTFVEVRALFPAELVPGAPRRDADRLPSALAEERRFASEANARRNLARAGLLVPVVGLISFLVMFFSYGKEYGPEVGEYERELPGSYPPAVMGYLWRFKRTKPDDLTATLLDLARRGHLRIEQEQGPGGTRHRFVLVRPPDPGAEDFEKSLLDWAFGQAGDGRQVTDAEMEARASSDPGFGSWYLRWSRQVADAAGRHGLFENDSSRSAWFNGLIGVVFVVAGIVIIGLGSPTGAAGIAWGVLQTALSPVIRRRSLKGATDHARWKAFKRFLGDFSEMERMPPSALSVWEQYLVYAVPLGMADQVVKTMRRLVPAPTGGPSGADLSRGSWITCSSPGGPDFGALTSSLGSFSSSVSSAIAPSSDGGGGGGGSSGGGGGGGGGGGVSAD